MGVYTPLICMNTALFWGGVSERPILVFLHIVYLKGGREKMWPPLVPEKNAPNTFWGAEKKNFFLAWVATVGVLGEKKSLGQKKKKKLFCGPRFEISFEFRFKSGSKTSFRVG